jgi:predicted hydrocarbon binding protein
LLLRKPFFKPAILLLAEVERRAIERYIRSTTVTTIHYWVGKTKGRKMALKHIENLLKIFQISQVDSANNYLKSEKRFKACFLGSIQLRDKALIAFSFIN